MDALELLRDDHQQMLDLLAKLEASPTVAQGSESAVLHARKNLVTEVVMAESRHEAVEEHDGRAHIEYEQNEVWPRLRNSVGSEELDDLGARMAAAKKHAPTRPHPDTPPSPGALNTVGRVAAFGDRIRDSLSHLGK
ncbi:hypothetical protein [Amycolatopsis sp.]|uniref:hypothetical protein n=1 Tax=Amycolatopsis sp. TaxID=37632 RepID=UPI002CFCC673|nr:hypothetical protein [Amycolatopsis sp.]HVV09266.1 hypothetical protein [Amycolatopsis sp.]